jgi:hypothetical protein
MSLHPSQNESMAEKNDTQYDFIIPQRRRAKDLSYVYKAEMEPLQTGALSD